MIPKENMYSKHIIISEYKYKANICRKILVWFPNLALKTESISLSANKQNSRRQFI